MITDASLFLFIALALARTERSEVLSRDYDDDEERRKLSNRKVNKPKRKGLVYSGQSKVHHPVMLFTLYDDKHDKNAN